MSARPILIVASKNEIMAKSLENYLKLFLGEHLPHRLHKPLALTCREELHEILDKLSQEEIFNTVCVVDLTEENIQNLKPLSEDNSSLRPSELVLCYPEVYWIFLVSEYPELEIQSYKTVGESYKVKRKKEKEKAIVINGKDKDIEKLENEEKDIWVTYDAILHHHFIMIGRIDVLIVRLACHANGFRTCFDPTGLRGWAGEFSYKEYDFTYEPNNKNNVKPCRGVVLDEETNFAFLNGYILYRHGYEVNIVQTCAEAKELTGGEFHIILEDVDIQFRDCVKCKDQNGNDGGCKKYKKLEGKLDEREKVFPFLKPQEGSKRVFISFMSRDKCIDSSDFSVDEFKGGLNIEELCQAITKDNCNIQLTTTLNPNTIEWVNAVLTISDLYKQITTSKKATNNPSKRLKILKSVYDDSQNKEALERLNRSLLEEFYPKETPKSQSISGYLKSKNKVKEMYDAIQKPHGGVFDEKIINNIGSFLVAQPKIDIIGDHSAPYLNLSIAEALLNRARRFASSVNGTVEAVHVATLALEAKEILGSKTPFLSLEALKLQHQMEAIAECSFVGTGININDVERRFDAIEDEIKKICDENKLELKQRYSALIEISDDLRQVYRDYEQFEEEEEALKKVRKYRLRLKYSKGTNETTKGKTWYKLVLNSINNLHRKLSNTISAKIEGYFNLLLESGYNIIFACFLWIVIFGSIYSCPFVFTNKDIWEPWINSASTFIALQPITDLSDQNVYFLGITIVEMITGFLHLGIFIAYLYQKIARK